MSQQGYVIKPVQAEDKEKIMNLLQRTFFIDEPLNQAIGLYNDGNCPELEEYCTESLPGDGWCFKAVDAEGNIVGVMINGIWPIKEAENGGDYLTMAEKCQNHKFQKILYVLARREEGARLWEKFPDDNQVLDVKIAATDPNWRKRGIMNALLEATEKVTKERGIRILRMDTSSFYSAMSAERLGFTCMYSAPYTELKMDGRPLIVPEPPHVDDRVYVKIMFERKK